MVHQKSNSSLAYEKLIELFEKKYQNPEKSIILVVIGAGASFSSGLPPWNSLIDDILKCAKNCYRNSNEFIEILYERTSNLLGIIQNEKNIKTKERFLKEKVSVETILSICCESSVVSNNIYKLFYDHYNFDGNHGGPPPQIGYEILAHLLKHHYIDHMITFNFDEILDTAVRNELGVEGFELIESDHSVVQNIQPNKPRLIKPHGSISKPQTMKFIDSNTQYMSKEMIYLLDNTLGFVSNIDQDIKNKKKVYILSIGYAWRDLDILNWLKSRLDKISKIFVIRKEIDEESLISQISSSMVDIISTMDLSKFSEHLNTTVRRAIDIDQLLWAFIDSIENKLSRQRIPFISSARHKILGVLFGAKYLPPGILPLNLKKIKKGIETSTAFERFRMEANLHLIKCKGMINTSVMAEDPRLNYYHNILKYHNIRKSGSVEKSTLPIDELNEIKSSDFADVKETYFSVVSNKQSMFENLYYKNNPNIYPKI